MPLNPDFCDFSEDEEELILLNGRETGWRHDGGAAAKFVALGAVC